MNERKSWPGSQTVKGAHAFFECLAHNLALLFERHLIASEGMEDKLEEKRKEDRARHGRNREGKPLAAAGEDFTRRSGRSIRCLGAFLYHAVPWSQAIASPAGLMEMLATFYPEMRLKTVPFVTGLS